jgi:hypothetical protein
MVFSSGLIATVALPLRVALNVTSAPPLATVSASLVSAAWMLTVAVPPPRRLIVIPALLSRPRAIGQTIVVNILGRDALSSGDPVEPRNRWIERIDGAESLFPSRGRCNTAIVPVAGRGFRERFGVDRVDRIGVGVVIGNNRRVNRSP